MALGWPKITSALAYGHVQASPHSKAQIEVFQPPVMLLSLCKNAIKEV